MKEKNPADYLTHPRAHFFTMCDKIALPYSNKNIDRFVNNSIWQGIDSSNGLAKLNIFSLPYPYNIDFIRKFYNRPMKVSKQIIISNNNSAGRGFEETHLFATEMGNKYSFNVCCPSVNYNEWLNIVSESLCCISLDPSHEIGQIPIECAILGTLFIGSNMDAAEELWPSCCGIKQDHLESRIQKLNNIHNYMPVLFNAYHYVTERHSFDSFRKKFEEIIK